MVGRPSSADAGRPACEGRGERAPARRAGCPALGGGAPPRPIRIPLLRTPGNRPPQRTQPTAALSGAGRTAIWIPREGDARGPSRPDGRVRTLACPRMLWQEIWPTAIGPQTTLAPAVQTAGSQRSARTSSPWRGVVRVADLRPNPHGAGAGPGPLATGAIGRTSLRCSLVRPPRRRGVARCSRWGGGASHSRGAPAPSKTSRKSRPCAPRRGGRGSQRRRHQ